jgi:hypothetical protein
MTTLIANLTPYSNKQITLKNVATLIVTLTETCKWNVTEMFLNFFTYLLNRNLETYTNPLERGNIDSKLYSITLLAGQKMTIGTIPVQPLKNHASSLFGFYFVARIISHSTHLTSSRNGHHQ